MSGADKDMDEFLDEIRALRSGEAPPPRQRPETPRVGYVKGFLLFLPAAFVAIALLSALTRWLALPFGGYNDIAIVLALVFMTNAVDDMRPATRRHWAILVATAVAAGAVSAVAATGVVWLVARFVPKLNDSAPTAVAVMVACSAAVLLVLWIADRLTRADNLIFPRDAEDVEGGAG